MISGTDPDVITRLLPMHMIIGPMGEVISCGPTLRKVIGTASSLDQFADLQRPLPADKGPVAMLEAIRDAAQSGARILLALRKPQGLLLRGHGTLLNDGQVLVNFGFGTGLVNAVERFNLTDADFAPDDLAAEYLLLHWASRALLGGLSGAGPRHDEARQQAESHAFIDPLTGLSNRRALELAMTLALSRMTADPADAGFALAHIDLDHFQMINDEFCHEAGDEVLCRVAEVLRGATHMQDVVARFGGDRFVLILPGMTRYGALDALFSHLIAEIEEPIQSQAGLIRVSASIGVTLSLFHHDGSASAMHRAADLALRSARQSGRGCWQLAQPDKAGGGVA